MSRVIERVSQRMTFGGKADAVSTRYGLVPGIRPLNATAAAARSAGMAPATKILLRRPLRRQHEPADDRTDDRSDAAYAERPPHSRRANDRRIEHRRQRVDARLRALHRHAEDERDRHHHREVRENLRRQDHETERRQEFAEDGREYPDAFHQRTLQDRADDAADAERQDGGDAGEDRHARLAQEAREQTQDEIEDQQVHEEGHPPGAACPACGLR